ncbi:MAG: HAD-IA family hydrolase, partial [Bacteroidota bacterium]
NAVRVLQQMGISCYFETIVDGTSVEKGKPDPEVFLKGAKELDLAPAHCIVFEDAERGVEAALRGGFWVVGVGDPQSLGAAHHVIPGFEDLQWEDLLRALPQTV